MNWHMLGQTVNHRQPYVWQYHWRKHMKWERNIFRNRQAHIRWKCTDSYHRTRSSSPATSQCWIHCNAQGNIVLYNADFIRVQKMSFLINMHLPFAQTRQEFWKVLRKTLAAGFQSVTQFTADGGCRYFLDDVTFIL
jgi:hypothetical protein